MWMTDYIQEIQRQFITKYGFKEAPGRPGIPGYVPDGDYPMIIEGKLDNVRVVNGFISCCNFTEGKRRDNDN
jgi:hypothetical protein